MADALANLALMNSVVAQTTSSSTPYQALVVIYLLGGNDGNNMLMPQPGNSQYGTGNGSQYNLYKQTRGALGIVDSARPLNGGQYAIHPSLEKVDQAGNPVGGVQSLFNSNQLAFVANVGTLCYPLKNGNNDIGTIPVPPQLFSHADQAMQWQSSISDQPFQTGWGGRIADIMLMSQGTNPPPISMCISLAGTSKLLVGTSPFTQQYGVSSTNGVVTLNPGSAGTSPWQNVSIRGTAVDQLSNYAYSNLLDQSYAEVLQQATSDGALVGSNLGSATDSLFDTQTYGTDGLMGQLKMVAKIMAGRSTLLSGAAQRQIFFCAVPGYDTHQNQLSAQASLMDELGQALWAFNQAVNSLNLSNNVLTLTHSDFTRTLIPNGNVSSTAGSDHGWGGHQIVMGGPVIGGQVYGTFPLLSPGGIQDVNQSTDITKASYSPTPRGRWIPSTAVDQYLAVVANWFGVSKTNLSGILPNLGRFDDPFSGTSLLKFLNPPPTS